MRPVLKLRCQSADGHPVLLLGLTPANIERLTGGSPIVLDPADLGDLALPPMMVIVHYGQTDAAILAEVDTRGVVIIAAPPQD